MSFAPQTPHDDPPTEPAPEAQATASCPRCGAPLRPDQDWCLNCGAAVTTEVAGAPSWRTPIAIVGVVLLLAAGALVFAFLEISDDADRLAEAPAPTPAATPAPPAPTPDPGAAIPATPTPDPAAPAPTETPAAEGTPAPPAETPPADGTFASWPEGETAWTVVLFSATSREEAEEKARGFQAGGREVGILESDQYSSLNPGYWVVYSGQYDTREQAQTEAETWQDTASGAYARRVAP